MDKEKIIEKISDLTRKVKAPGRKYTKDQRDEMRKEISVLKIDLDKIKYEEDLSFINEYQQKNHPYIIQEGESFKNKIDEIVNSITDPKLLLALENKLKVFYNDLKNVPSSPKDIRDLVDALGHLENNETIPTSNQYCYRGKEEIQKSLAVSYRVIAAKIKEINYKLSDIQRIYDFFINDNSLSGFVFLSNAVFSEASNFEKGYACVEQKTKKMYFTYNGNAYKNECKESDLPKIQNVRLNPDLIPFQINDSFFNYLWGYKNSNGEIIIPAKFRNAKPFVNGFAKVSIDKRIAGQISHKEGLIDGFGRLALHFNHPFFEIDDVYNDIVKYTKHIYAPETYEFTNSFNFDVKLQTNYKGLYSGFLIYKEIKPIIINQIENILRIKNEIPNLKTNREVQVANENIKDLMNKIDFYLKYIAGDI
jgi:hypothetical protein